MESIDELVVKLKGDVGNWEKAIFNWACNLAQEVAIYNEINTYTY
jgi:hypothetical protein